jgi:glycosyltransferase involved in cell wall biosynthesis
MVKVSVIIPVYNTEKLLERCLESVVGQTLSDIEIICVDDGSTDGSGALLDSWAERDSRIRVIHQQNGRQGKARNAAMRIATGEYIGMIDSDDYIPSDYFERLYAAATAADADMAICGIVKQKRTLNRTVLAFEHEEVATTVTEKLRLAHCPPEFHPVNKLYRRAMLDRLSLRFAEGVQYEDVMFVTRALVGSNRLVSVPGVHYFYVLNPTSTVKSRQTAAKQLQKYNAHRAMVDYLEACGVVVAPRHRSITVRYFSLSGLCLWKIKECGHSRTFRLFDVVPLWRWMTRRS